MEKKNDIKPYKLVCTLFMKKGETTREDFFEFLYDSKKKAGWLNAFPIFFKSNSPKFDIGAKTSFNLVLPPCKYYMICKEFLPEKKGFLVEIDGLLKGSGRIELIETEEGIQLYHELIIAGKNKFMHKYYGPLCKGHDDFMNKRLESLREQLLKYSVQNRS